MSRHLQAEIICFAYRGFSDSDRAKYNEQEIAKDVEAITSYFAKLVKDMGGDERVEALIWGKSFGCATAIQSLGLQPDLYDIAVLESPFTSVPAVFRSIVPFCGLGRLLG